MSARDELARLRELHEKATPGPWRAGRMDTVSYDGNGEHPHKNVYGPHYEETPRARIPIEVARGEGENCLADAALIAAMRNAIPALLAAAEERERLSAEVERLRRENDVLNVVTQLCCNNQDAKAREGGGRG